MRAGLQARRRGRGQLKVELVADAAAALAVAALRAPGAGDAGAVEIDPATGVLTAPPAAFRAFVTGERPAGHPLLAAAAGAVRGAAGPLTIESDGPVVEAWAGDRAAALTVVGEDGRVRLVPVARRALEAAVLALAGLDEDAPAPPGVAVAMPAEALARTVAGDPAAVAAAPLTGIREYRRVAAARDGGAVELLRADDGLRRVVSAGEQVELRPASAAELRAEVAALVAATQRR